MIMDLALCSGNTLLNDLRTLLNKSNTQIASYFSSKLDTYNAQIHEATEFMRGE